jgi:hypothetical protein
MTDALWMTGSPGAAAGRYAPRLAASRAKQLSGAGNRLEATKPEMTRAGSTGGVSSPRAAAREARAERLAAALKINLRRRKAQARERAAETGQREHETEPATKHDRGS